jgi:hypothetical protein
MIKPLIFIACLLNSIVLHGQELSDVCVQDESTITFRQSFLAYTKFEVPPFILNGCYRGYLGVDGIDTEFIPLRQNLIDGTNAGSCGYGPITSSGTSDITIYKNNASTVISINSNSNLSIWKKNYAGAYSGHVIPRSTDYLNAIFIHGEYKFDCGNNVILPGPSPCNEGANYWTSYYAFLSAEWLVSNAANNWGYGVYSDIGPIAWPAAGYKKNGVKASQGFRHPSSIRHGDYIYIYVQESTLGPFDVSGSKAGIKLFRVHVNSVTNPNAYKVYYNGNWVNSLPSGFNKNNIASFFGISGPSNSLIVGNWATYRFSVAKLKNTNFFIGVEEYGEIGYTKVALRLSSDLINWSERSVIYSKSGEWIDSKLHYPIFLDKTGWHNDQVDPEEFYVLGSYSEPSSNWNKITRMKLSFDCSQFSMHTGINLHDSLPITDFESRKHAISFENDIVNSEINLEVYPNPATDKIELILSNWSGHEYCLLIRDITGKEIKEFCGAFDLNNPVLSLDISSFKSGIYLYEFKSSTHSQNGRIIKE